MESRFGNNSEEEDVVKREVSSNWFVDCDNLTSLSSSLLECVVNFFIFLDLLRSRIELTNFLMTTESSCLVHAKVAS